MIDRKLKNYNLIFRILIFVSFILGMRIIMSYCLYIVNYATLEKDQIGNMVSGIILDYAVFIVCTIAVLVFNFLSRESVRQMIFISRSIVLIVAEILVISSLSAIAAMGGIGLAKFGEDYELVKEYYNSELVDFLLVNPHSFYTYMVSVGIFFIMSAVTLIAWIAGRRKSKFNHYV